MGPPRQRAGHTRRAVAAGARRLISRASRPGPIDPKDRSVAVSSVVIVPAAPLLLPEASPSLPEHLEEAVTDLRHQVDVALRSLPEAGTALLLDSGPESLVHDAPIASLAAYGSPHVQSAVTIDTDLLAAVSARGQAPRVRSDDLDGDPSVLALLLASVRPDLAIAPVTVPAGASAAGLADIAVGIEAAANAVSGPVGLVAAGDLAATLDASSPGYLVEDAARWDTELTDAVRRLDPGAVGVLGPGEAARVQARGWAPVVVAVLLAAARGDAFEQVVYAAPRGVGQLVAS
jgi:hypothetical protein